jgi:hypothetical protein
MTPGAVLMRASSRSVGARTLCRVTRTADALLAAWMMQHKRVTSDRAVTSADAAGGLS